MIKSLVTVLILLTSILANAQNENFQTPPTKKQYLPEQTLKFWKGTSKVEQCDLSAFNFVVGAHLAWDGYPLKFKNISMAATIEMDEHGMKPPKDAIYIPDMDLLEPELADVIKEQLSLGHNLMIQRRNMTPEMKEPNWLSWGKDQFKACMEGKDG